MTPEDVQVGVQAGGALVGLLAGGLHGFDYLEVIPDRCWTDRGLGREPRYEEDPAQTALVAALADLCPIWAHGIGLSIASSSFDEEHARQLAAWHHRFGFETVSEHLAAFRIIGDGASPVDHHAGLSLPIPWDRDVLDLVVERTLRLQDLLGCQVLLENGAVHTPVPGCDLTETEFLCELVERSGCGLLLDLHNLYVNSTNNGADSLKALAAFPLDAVEEIHVAGGRWMFGAYLDAHAGPCPDAVWDLLSAVAPRCSSLAGVTFEVHESYVPQMGVSGVQEQIDRARAVLCNQGGELSPTTAFSAR